MVSVLVVQDAHPSHHTSQPCSLSISKQTIPVTYRDAPRNNPDGTYYPGDSFYYVFSVKAGPSCVSFQLLPLLPSDGISIDHMGIINDGSQNHSVDWHDGDPYVDSDSASKLYDTLQRKCGNIAQYSACVFGKATVTHHPKCPVAAEPCIDHTQKIEQEAKAVKRVCTKTADGIKCRNITITRTGTITPPILGPDLKPVLTLETLIDSDGYAARNLDGTYYQWDPITVLNVPHLKWKDSRENTIHFEMQKKTKLVLEKQTYCKQNFCNLILKHPGISASVWPLGNGDGLDIYNATDASHLGLHKITYVINAYNNNDVALDSATVSIDALAVRYDPVYDQYPYSLLADDMRTAYENRAAIALHYFGSVGGGSDDIAGLHENRRSKINDFYYAGFGFDPWHPIQLDNMLYWSDASDVGILDEHKDVAINHAKILSEGHGDVVPCIVGGNETAMLVRAGYCKIFFEYPVLDTVITPLGPRYENVTLFNTLISKEFAGKDTTYLSHYEYMFPESLFHTDLSIRAIGTNNTKSPMMIPISVKVLPLMDNQTHTVSEYLYDKVYHDSQDGGLARIISNDTFPLMNQESGTGHVDTKLHRMSVKFEMYLNQGRQEIDGLKIEDLASEYFVNSRKAKFEVPLSVGLGALAPVSVMVHANNQSMQYDYSYVDFGTNHTITLNVAQDNALVVSRQQDVVSIEPPPHFEKITALYIDDILTDISCPYGCAIRIPSDRTASITAENAWGGQAHGIVPEFIEEPNPSVQDVAADNLLIVALFALSLPILYWIYHQSRKK